MCNKKGAYIERLFYCVGFLDSIQGRVVLLLIVPL